MTTELNNQNNDNLVTDARKLAPHVLMAAGLSLFNQFTTTNLIVSFERGIIDDATIALFGLSHFATAINCGFTMKSLFDSNKKDELPLNFAKSLLSVAPLIGTYMGIQFAIEASKPIDIAPPPTPPITPTWMVPDLRQQVMNEAPRFANLLGSLQSVLGRVLTSM